ncbi:uncharacterized protein ACBT44_008804 [Syngnathus typhle]
MAQIKEGKEKVCDCPLKSTTTLRSDSKRKMASNLNKVHLRKVNEKNQMCDGTLHLTPFGIYDLLNTQKCLKDFFIQRGMFGDVNQVSSQKAKERDEKINKLIKSIVEKSIADIAKMRQLIALWDAEERSTSNSYIDESSYGLVTQQKIKQYLRDFFSERLASAEPTIDLNSADLMLDPVTKEEGPGSLSSQSSPILGKAMNMISHVIQPVVDTFDSASKAVVKMLTRSDRDAQEPDEGAQQKWAPHPSEEEEASSASPQNNINGGRQDDNRLTPAVFNEAVMDEFGNLQFDMQLTPRLSPILEETGETNSSASSSSARLDKTPATSISALENTKTIQSDVPSRPCTADEKLTPRVSPFSPEKPNSTDENISDAESYSDKEAVKPCSAIEACPTSRLLAASPVPSPVTSSPIIEKAKTIINQVFQPVVKSIGSARKVTKTAGKSIAKKVRSMCRYRSRRKRGKRGKGKSGKTSGRRDILDRKNGNEEVETVDACEEVASTTEVDSKRDSEVVASPEASRCITEDKTVGKSARVTKDLAGEKLSIEAKSPSVISTPFSARRMVGSSDPISSAQATPRKAKTGTPRTPKVPSCKSTRRSSISENKVKLVETDDDQASEINPLQSEEDGSEQNIYSIFENIFREEFSKKLENSLKQGICDAVRVYVPDRGSTESLQSANNYAKPEIDTSQVGPRDSLRRASTSLTSFTSYQLLEDAVTRKHLSDTCLKGPAPPEGLDSKRKSLWKRWKMRRAKKILPGLLDCRCSPGPTDSVASDGKATEPAIKSILKKVTSIWK